jgi:xylulokinase
VSLLAVDMGSSSCKAVVFSEDGCALAQKSCSYPAATSLHPSWAEMPAENFWNALVTVCQAVSCETSKDVIEVLAISSHGETFIPVDAQQRALAPAILNYDNRAATEANWIEEKTGRASLFEVTGLTAHPMYPVAKILWLRKYQPDIYAKAAQFLGVPDYLRARFGLPTVIDYSLASRFLAFDIRKRAWSEEVLSACKMEAEQFAQPVPAGTIAGELPQNVASELGLRAGVPVVVGGHDQPCAALGSGVIDQGRISASLGTYECLVAASRAPARSESALAANLNTYCHVVSERYVTLAFFPAGIMLDWFLRLVSSPELAGTASVRELCSHLEAEASTEPTGLCVTPHLLGTCNPDFNPNATGVIAGLHPNTSRADVYKGILEGIACEFADMAELLQTAVGPFKNVYVSGGGARSPLGIKLRAAFSGCALHRMKQSEAVCMGTAILAGVAVGKYASYEEAIERLLAVAETVAPSPEIAESYKGQRQQYRLLYASLAPLRRVQGAGH